MMDNTSFKIYVLYELNNEKQGEERYWSYKDMPPTAEWIGFFEKDKSGKWGKRETIYPREEQFQCEYKYKEELIHYLNLVFSDLLLHKQAINRFIVTQ